MTNADLKPIFLTRKMLMMRVRAITPNTMREKAPQHRYYQWWPSFYQWVYREMRRTQSRERVPSPSFGLNGHKEKFQGRERLSSHSRCWVTRTQLLLERSQITSRFTCFVIYHKVQAILMNKG